MRPLLLIGTRPEVIKMAPLAAALQERPDRFQPILVDTRQHTDLKSGAMAWFGLQPDLSITQPWQSDDPYEALGRLVPLLKDLLASQRPDILLVQGDTTTALAGALAAKEVGIPIAHVEAGLRSGNLQDPWPEEEFRIRISSLASLHFAPTETDRQNLHLEGIPDSAIHVTGNTVIDALVHTLSRLPHAPSLPFGVAPEGYILCTLHRRENFAHRLPEMKAILEGVARVSGLPLLLPMHHNPRVRAWALHRAANIPGVRLLPPQDYPDLIALLRHCRLVLSDSGGLQEEATFLQRPMLLLRECTERPDALTHGAVSSMGTEPEAVLHSVSGLLESGLSHPMDRSVFGEGKAAPRIVELMDGYLHGLLK